MIEVERVDFVGVPVRDAARAREFYGATLGLRERTAPDDTWPEFETSNLTLGIMEPERIGRPFEPNPAPIALRVGDVEAARRRLEEAGIAFEGETIDTGVCHMAFFRDPDGNALMLHHRYAPPRPWGEGRG
jgi:predicted enzyme related to lactoylglutathione lyase